MHLPSFAAPDIFLSRRSIPLSCPVSGTFYACSTGARFVGCCSSDPCAASTADLGCPAGNLYPASFSSYAFETFPYQECSSARCHTGVKETPPFMGCCKINPDNCGCLTASLTAGCLSSDPTIVPSLLNNGKDSAIKCNGMQDACGDKIKAGLSESAQAGITIAVVVTLAVMVGLFIYWKRTGAKAREISNMDLSKAPETGES